MDRRHAIASCLAFSGVAISSVVWGQQSANLRRVFFVHPSSRKGNLGHLFGVFREALHDLGYVEGRDIVVESRWGEGRLDLLPSLATDVVAQNPAVIVTATTASVAAFKKATSSIPIVFATAGNPIEQGFVATLQRPGGNITGVLVYTGLVGKLVEITHEALPQTKRIALLMHDRDPASQNEAGTFEDMARRYKMSPVMVPTSGPEDFDRLFAELAKQRVDAVVVPQLAMFASYRDPLIDRALKARLPLLTPQLDFAERGALLSYGTPREDNYRRVAAIVDKILRGMKASDIPVEQPDRFLLIINRRTAKLIGAKIAPAMNGRADRVID